MRVVVGIDGSRTSAAALRWAAEEARRRGCPLTAVHALATRSAHSARRYDAVLHGQVGRAAEAVVQRVLEEQEDALAGLEVTRRIVLDPSPARALLDVAAQGGLLVIGARGAGGFRNLIIGSMCDQAVRHAACPVVVVPLGWEQRAQRRLVVGVDGSADSLAALEWASEAAALHAAHLEAVHAHRPEDGSEAGEALLDAAVGELGDPSAVQRRVVPGPPAAVLSEGSRAADLLVLGSRGREGFRGLLLGSVSRQVLQRAACPVVIVRSRQPLSP